MNYKMIVRYDGSRYLGWQRLKDNEMTIQAKLEQVLSRRFDESINVIGSGRTDKGVHSYGQVANFHSENVDENQLLDYINDYLPEDILVVSLEKVDERFHSRYNAISKTYQYEIFNGKHVDPFNRKYITSIAEKLDVEKMKRASRNFIGEHDFTAFTTSKSKKKSNIRIINDIEIIEEGQYITIRVEGNGFLHNMVRIIVGTLIRVGKSELDPEAILSLINGKNRSLTGPIAEGKGLFLKEVYY